ncbi:glycosyltransferase [Ruminococcus sp. AF18-22]|nr:glycosyltransferase [Ruminococcus sp. AF18-22]
MKKKVVLLVLSPFDDLETFEHRPMQEARYFYDKGYQVEIYTLQRKVLGKGIEERIVDGILVKHFLCKTKKMDINLHEKKVFKILKPMIYMSWVIKFILFLRKEWKKDKNNYLIAHNLEMAAIALFAKRGKKNKLIFVMRELYEGQTKNSIKSMIIHHISQIVQNKSDFLVHVVPEQKNHTTKKNRKKIIYIPNYPESTNYDNINFVKSDKLRINYIGSVRDKKSLKMLMDAAREIPGIEVGIHGMGDAYSQLKEIEKNYDNVTITGYYDYQKDTRSLFAGTDIIYCAYDIEVPNWRIAYPIKLYEAIEAGIPVMLCRGMAPVQLIEEKNCGFVFPYNKSSLHELLVYLDNNREEVKEKKESMKKLRGKYTWASVVQRYDRIFDVKEN